MFFISFSTHGMEQPTDETQEERLATTNIAQRLTPLEKETQNQRALTLLRSSNEGFQRVVEFLRASSLNPQGLEHVVGAIARRYGLTRQVVNETIIPIFNYLCPRPYYFPILLQNQYPAPPLFQQSESYQITEAPQLRRQLKIVLSFIPFLPLELIIQDPEHFPRRPSLLLTNGAEEEREQNHHSAATWQQRTFDWVYSINEYIETHLYLTIMWGITINILFNFLRR